MLLKMSGLSRAAVERFDSESKVAQGPGELDATGAAVTARIAPNVRLIRPREVALVTKSIRAIVTQLAVQLGRHVGANDLEEFVEIAIHSEEADHHSEFEFQVGSAAETVFAALQSLVDLLHRLEDVTARSRLAGNAGHVVQIDDWGYIMFWFQESGPATLDRLAALSSETRASHATVTGRGQEAGVTASESVSPSGSCSATDLAESLRPLHAAVSQRWPEIVGVIRHLGSLWKSWRAPLAAVVRWPEHFKELCWTAPHVPPPAADGAACALQEAVSDIELSLHTDISRGLAELWPIVDVLALALVSVDSREAFLAATCSGDVLEEDLRLCPLGRASYSHAQVVFTLLYALMALGSHMHTFCESIITTPRMSECGTSVRRVLQPGFIPAASRRICECVEGIRGNVAQYFDVLERFLVSLADAGADADADAVQSLRECLGTREALDAFLGAEGGSSARAPVCEEDLTYDATGRPFVDWKTGRGERQLQALVHIGHEAALIAVSYSDWLLSAMMPVLPDGAEPLPKGDTHNPCRITVDPNWDEMELARDYAHMCETVMQHFCGKTCQMKSNGVVVPGCRFKCP
ncbi:hypothetical protein, partial [Silvimonas sp.]|uniref:hypothetical protein n=1 Tax=Silvimonas sp. TaxID=2650811 RepID=UPI0028516F23